MKIGIPKESKIHEGRVALIPAACADLVHGGHSVYIQKGAGILSGCADSEYEQAGVQVLESAAAVYQQAQLIVKVKEPVGQEINWLKSHHILFSFLHLAAEPELLAALVAIGLEAIAFETVLVDQQLPLLAPMSKIAGIIAAQVGTKLLYQSDGGSGLLLGGVAGTERGEAVVLGAGVAGFASAQILAALGANVTVFDKKPDRLDTIRRLGHNVTALYPYESTVANYVQAADLLIGAVLIPGAKAPRVVSRDTIKGMRPGSVVVDISVDQGGCIETTRPTTYAEPTYKEHEITHFAVTNMPGAVPRTATQALSAVLLPFVANIANGSWKESKSVLAGLNVSRGKIVHPALLKPL